MFEKVHLYLASFETGTPLQSEDTETSYNWPSDGSTQKIRRSKRMETQTRKREFVGKDIIIFARFYGGFFLEVIFDRPNFR
jgi:hypothetical protein